MFKVEFKVRDSDLGAAMREAKTHAVGKPVATLIEDETETVEVEEFVSETPPARRTPTYGKKPPAKSAKRAVKRKGSGGKSLPVGETMPDKVAKWLLETKPPRILGETIKQGTVAIGGAPGSYSYVIQQLKAWGILSEPDDWGEYTMYSDVFTERLEKANVA